MDDGGRGFRVTRSDAVLLEASSARAARAVRLVPRSRPRCLSILTALSFLLCGRMAAKDSLVNGAEAKSPCAPMDCSPQVVHNRAQAEFVRRAGPRSMGVLLARRSRSAPLELERGEQQRVCSCAANRSCELRNRRRSSTAVSPPGAALRVVACTRRMSAALHMHNGAVDA